MSTTYRCVRRGVFAVAALLVATIAHAQNISIAAANSTNDRVYSVNFSADTATIQNTDWASFGSIQSLAFTLNPSEVIGTQPAGAALDLAVADTTGGKIAVYTGYFSKGASSVATVIWKASQGGPAAPNGLSVDAAGDLFVVNATAGAPQLWVFPAASASIWGTTATNCPSGLATLANYPALCGLPSGSPVLLDNNFPAGQVLVDTAVLPAVAPAPALSSNLANTGDLLVITSNPASVLDYALTYSSSGISVTRSTLPVPFPPGGTTPGGITFWPFGSTVTNNSLLITSQNANSILQFSCCSSADFQAMANFATNVPGSGQSTLYKIKTGYQNGGQPFAFVDQAGAVGQLLEYDEAGLVTVIAPKGNHPEGLAVTNEASALANACSSKAGGCNPTGLLSALVPGNSSPAVAQGPCVVQQDPRVTVTPQGMSCSSSLYPNGLPVNAVCGAGFDTTNSMVIPNSMCGSPGFTLIKSYTDDTAFNGLLVDGDAQLPTGLTCLPTGAESPPAVPGSSPTPATLLWGPLANRGQYIANGNTHTMLDVPDGCGSVHYTSGGGSLWGLDLVLNLPGVVPAYGAASPTQLGTLVDNKYGDFEATVSTLEPVNISLSVAEQLALNQAGCVSQSQSFFDFAQVEGSNSAQQAQDYLIAADLLSNVAPITCDSIVTAAPEPGSFNQTTVSSPPVLNPSGQVRMRLANLYFSINTRVLGNCPNTQSPPNFTQYPGQPGVGGCPAVTPPEWPPTSGPVPPSGFPTPLPPQPDNQTSCVPAGYYPPPGGCPALNVPQALVAGAPVAVSFTLLGSNNAPAGCTLTSTDGAFNATSVQASPQNYPFSGAANGTVPAGAAPSNNDIYTLTCPYPGTGSAQLVTVSQTVSVAAPPQPPGVTVSPGRITDDAQVATITWTEPSGASSCKLTDSSTYKKGPGGKLSGTTSSAGAGTFTAQYTSSEADGGYTLTFTAACTSGAPKYTGTLSVTE